MSKLFKENGFLSEYGDSTFQQYLDKEISVLLNGAKSESELRLIGSLIVNRVGNMVADRVVDLNKNTGPEKSAECTGHWWRDEYGNEAFVHGEYTYCSVHDSKITVKV